jgi:hypothetical protein
MYQTQGIIRVSPFRMEIFLVVTTPYNMSHSRKTFLLGKLDSPGYSTTDAAFVHADLDERNSIKPCGRFLLRSNKVASAFHYCQK